MSGLPYEYRYVYVCGFVQPSRSEVLRGMTNTPNSLGSRAILFTRSFPLLFGMLSAWLACVSPPTVMQPPQPANTLPGAGEQRGRKGCRAGQRLFSRGFS